MVSDKRLASVWKVAGDSAGAELTVTTAIVAFFERIACEEGWQPGGELRIHADRSFYFALGDITGSASAGSEIVGGIQLVRPDSDGRLPCHRVWPETAVAVPTACAHIAVLAVARQWRGKDFRGTAAFWSLAAAMWRHCVESRITELWLEATPRTLACYRRLGWPLQVRGDLRMHWGEPCYLCSLDVPQVAGELAERAVRSESYRRILASGVGIAYPA